MMFFRSALFGAALFCSLTGGGGVAAAGASVQDGFLRDVTSIAEESGLMASDANVEVAVQLSDEEILANNPLLARFFETIEDEEKYAVWKEKRMPQLLLQIEASSRKSNKKQKKWARKAMVKSEIEACYPQNYWKQAAYDGCRRWEWYWFIPVCKDYSCYAGDNMIWPLCHHGCNGWKDDGTRCFKPCAGQSTTPTQCDMPCAYRMETPALAQFLI